MIDVPSLLRTGEVLHAGFNRYKIVGRVNNPEVQSTPNHTPTVVAYRLARIPPQLYLAKDIKGNQFAIKAVNEESLSLLVNEWRALEKLKWLQLILFMKQFAPWLKNGITYDSERKIYFIVIEWLDKKVWKNLGQVIDSKPLCIRSNAAKSMQILRHTLISATRILHFVGIIHGDSKDEHLYLYEKKGEIVFNQIRIIDFGGCYLHPLEDWKGGSLGFSSPYFWNHKHRLSLSKKEMEAIDWYGVYSMLFYAYTGECFPAASPAFSKIAESEIDHNARSYYEELEQVLLNKWQNYPDDVQLLIAECVHYLCMPDALAVPGFQISSVLGK